MPPLALAALIQEVKVQVSCCVTAAVFVQMSQTLVALVHEAKMQVRFCVIVGVLHSYAAA